MKNLLGKRIFMFFFFFPWKSNVKYFCCFTDCVTTSGHLPRGHGAKSIDVPSRSTRYSYRVNCCRVIQLFASLGKEWFPIPSQPCPHFALSADLLGFFVFECPDFYRARKCLILCLINLTSVHHLKL